MHKGVPLSWLAPGISCLCGERAETRGGSHEG